MQLQEELHTVAELMDLVSSLVKEGMGGGEEMLWGHRDRDMSP